MSKGIGIAELTTLLTANPRLVGAVRAQKAAGFLSSAELEALLAGSIGTADITNLAVTNAKLATPNRRAILAIPIDDLTNLTAGGEDIVTDILPGFAGTIEAIFYIGGTLATGVGATMALHVEIGAVAVTGGVLTLDEAGIVTPAVLGVYVAGTLITALNVFTNTDLLSLVNAAGGTVFTAGSGVVILVLSVAGQ